MRFSEIVTEKNVPNDPQLWGRAKAEASKRYKKHSAYKMGWASKWYKDKGGTWKTVSESDQLDEITRPEFREDAVEFLTSRGYEQLGSGTFANVFQRKSRPNEVIKLFSTSDDAYEAYIKFIMKNQGNPHFPRIIGKPMEITPDYYAVKLEKLEPVSERDGLGKLISELYTFMIEYSTPESLETYFDAFPKFREASEKLREFMENNSEHGWDWDLHEGNLMWRGKTLVLTDPIYNPEEFEHYAESSQLDEITRPETQKDADEILRNAGYKRVAHGAFGAVYEKGDKVIKTFSSIDTSYLKFIKMVKNSNNNPHFPMFFGDPIKITDGYYAVKQENLKPYRGDATAINYYIRYLMDMLDGEDNYTPNFYEEVEEIMQDYPRFKEACQMIAKMIHNDDNMMNDVYDRNLMVRGSTIVFVDPVANLRYDKEERSKLPDIHNWDIRTKEKPQPEKEVKWNPEWDKILGQLNEDLRDWFGKENWVDISRKEGGKHPECGASAGKGTRKKSNKSAYPKCVPAKKAQSMSKKEKESASRRKRETERKSSGNKVNQVSTKVNK